MGFKWFKARLSMNRMPVESSTIVGSYRSTMAFDTFDLPPHNMPISTNIHVNSVPKVSIRATSMPALNNPMAGIGDTENVRELVPKRKNETASISTAKSLQGLQGVHLDRGNYSTGGQKDAPLTKANFPQSSKDNIEKGGKPTPKSSPKNHKALYKKKKVKAPEPQLTTRSSDTSKKETTQFLMVGNSRKASQDSDIDV